MTNISAGAFRRRRTKEFAAFGLLRGMILWSLPVFAASFSFCVSAQERESATATTIAGKPKNIGPRKLLAMQGVGESYFTNLTDGQPLESDEEEILVRLFFAMRHFHFVEIERWAKEHRDFQWSDLEGQPSKNRGIFFPLRGVVTNLEVRRPVPEQVGVRRPAPEQVIDRFYRCECQLGEKKRPAVVYVRDVPEAWLPAENGKKIDEPVSFQGLFLKLAGGGDKNPHTPVFFAKHLAWHPPSPLGKAGVDESLFDDVVHHVKLTRADRDIFFGLHAAMKTMGADKAAETARQNLGRAQKSKGPARFDVKQIFSQAWKTKRLRRDIQKLRTFRRSAERAVFLRRELEFVDAQRRPEVMQELEKENVKLREGVKTWKISAKTLEIPMILVTEIEKIIAEKLRALHQHRQSPFAQGKPMVFEGTARRAVRVRVDEEDIHERFGIDHYYEMTVFIDLPFKHKDSERVFRSFPIYFCVASLPDGFPQGQQIHEKVRVAGVFFKVWPYSSQFSQARGAKLPDFTPLIVGREPVWLRPNREKNSLTMMIASGLFVLALVSVWLVMRRTSRGDVKFRIKTIDRQFEAQPGVSLNDQNLDG